MPIIEDSNTIEDVEEDALADDQFEEKIILDPYLFIEDILWERKYFMGASFMLGALSHGH